MSSTLTLAGLVNSILSLANTLIPILIGLALIAFFWGLIGFIRNPDSLGARSRGREVIMWGLIAMFVLVCIWGLVAFIRAAFLGS